MKKTICFCVVLAVQAACSNERGVGFDHYEVPAKKGLATGVDVQWRKLTPVPRYRVVVAETAESALAVLPVAKSPGKSVASVSAKNTLLRVVEDPARVWLVAEATSGTVADSAGLRGEAGQRSGCVVADGVTVGGSAVVFRLDCS